jgi:hypothetical protein
VSCGTLDTRLLTYISATRLLLPLAALSNAICLCTLCIIQVLTPKLRRVSVWALSISLAATLKIDVSFFSSGYLDVSVHRVPRATLFIHVTLTVISYRRVSPFGHPWLNARLQLPMAFRSLPRPSSALGAKAFTLCSY